MAPELHPVVALGRLVVEVCRPGNGRGIQSTAIEIAERLALADADVDDQQLADILVRLVECGRLVMSRPNDSAPIAYRVAVERFDAPSFDEVDLLASDICAVLREHYEGFEDDEQLLGWLAEAGVVPENDRQFERAMGLLERRLQTPRTDNWTPGGTRPALGRWLVPAVIHTG